MSITRMPVLFIGHGSPMNALADNDYTHTLKKITDRIPKPKVILCISAHWMTEGTWVTGMEKPKTIHDFYGFPKPLFDIQYPALGSPEVAKVISELITDPRINIDREMWGYDHGTWSVLRHMYPEADIPLIQLSLYMEQPGEYHYLLGEKLKPLRDAGVLIIGSGNVVHNLRQLDWSSDAIPHPWAIECDEWIHKKLEERDFTSLYENVLDSEAGRLSIPTPDHYYPFLYILGASNKDDELKFEYQGIHNASISMLSVSFGL